jgi:hypothetical protein
MPVALWWRFAEAEDARNFRDLLSQTHQRLAHFENDLASSHGDQRNITEELDCVSQPLLGVQQNPLSRQRFAMPKRKWQVPSRQKTPSPLIFPKTGLEIPKE